MIQRYDTGPRMSKMVVHNGTIYLAGQIADDAEADIAGQTREVLEAIDTLLARAGSDKSRILRAQIYLADLADFTAMNLVWRNGSCPATRRRARPCRPHSPIRNGRSRSSSPRRSENSAPTTMSTAVRRTFGLFQKELVRSIRALHTTSRLGDAEPRR